VCSVCSVHFYAVFWAVFSRSFFVFFHAFSTFTFSCSFMQFYLFFVTLFGSLVHHHAIPCLLITRDQCRPLGDGGGDSPSHLQTFCFTLQALLSIIHSIPIQGQLYHTILHHPHKLQTVTVAILQSTESLLPTLVAVFVVHRATDETPRLHLRHQGIEPLILRFAGCRPSVHKLRDV